MKKRPCHQGYVLRNAQAEDCYYAGPIKVGCEVRPLWVHPATEALLVYSQDRAKLVQQRLQAKYKREAHLCQLWVAGKKAVAVIEAPLAQRMLQPVLHGQYKKDITLFQSTFRTAFVTEASRQPS